MRVVSVLRDAATDEEFEITYTQLKRSSDAKAAGRYFHGVCSFLARSIREHNGVQQIGVHDTALPDRRHHADMLAPPAADRKAQEVRKKHLIDKI